MSEIVKLENIRVCVDALDSKDSIYKAGQLLIDNGSITQEYIDDMWKSVIELGPYMVLMPGFALAHSAPCPAVLKTDISLITLKNPVNFGSDNDPVKVVMCLACVDKEQHMSSIQQIAMKLMRDGIIDEMVECKTPEELHKLINEG